MVEEQKRTAAILPWETFTSALNQLHQGMPSRIDRTVFPGMAWNAQTQLFSALRFFGLLKGDDEPTTALHDLVKGTDEERAAKLKQAVEGAYAELIAIDLTKATRGHFEEELSRLYNVTGDSRVKAVRFFLKAAKQVGIPLSAFIAPKDGKAKGPRKPRASAPKKTAKKSEGETKTEVRKEEGAVSGESRTVNLKSGGTLAVSATTKFLSMSSEDRKFVFDLIEKLEAYEQA